MNISTTPFDNFPIKFKKINVEDFPHFEVDEKVNLELNNGYIGDSFIDNIFIEASNTVVLNCGVGSGKTTAIIRAIKQFYENEDYVIFIASPFVSLVEQYYNDVQDKGEIPQEDIYRNEWIGENRYRDISYLDKRVHVVTINTLLGNPGEDSPINSSAKRRYLDGMIDYCTSNNKKVIFIYDEIHDSIHNFKEKYIFNLWKWRNVIHKNFVISATFSEASKIVVEYLAELTSNKIKILEAERVRIPDRLSDLYLYYDNANKYTNENGNLISIVEDVIERGLDLDILCYSKKRCKEIIANRTSGVGKLLYEKYGNNIIDCTSGLENNERPNRDVHSNRFNKNSNVCNVGTNFKSGVSIEKDNHAFILIFPPASARGDFKNGFGIFSGGINSIIQALARKRKKGEIHILLPKPTRYNFDTFPFNETQKNTFKELIEPYQSQSITPSSNNIRDTKTIDYIELDSLNQKLYDFYNNELKANVLDSIEHLNNISSNRTNKARLEFPEFKLFQLESGEKYLANKYKYLGKDLSGYISYCAITNQFVNCNLVYSNWKPIQNFKEGILQYCFDKFYENYFDNEWMLPLKNNFSDAYIYHEIRNEIFNFYRIKLNDTNNNYKFIKPFKNKQFETQLVAFIQRKLFRNNQDFLIRYEDTNGWVKDDKYSRGDYFRACISHAYRLNGNENLSEDAELVVDAYAKLDYFRNKIVSSIQTRVIRGNNVQYIEKTPSESFITSSEMDSFNTLTYVLIEKDFFISKEIFDFKRIFNSNENVSSKINRFYSYLKKDFFKVKTRKIDGVDRDEILEEYPIPQHNKVLDFITPVNSKIPEDNMPTLKVIDGEVKIISTKNS